jgi:hypothetical protein
MTGKWLAATLLVFLPMQAGAMSEACMAKPSGLPREKCICFEHQLRKVLTPDEMRIEILAFEGKFRLFRREAAALGQEKATNFGERVAQVIGGSVCNK